MDIVTWAIVGNLVILVPLFICGVMLSRRNLGHKSNLVAFEFLYAVTILFGAFISTFSAITDDNKKSKSVYVILNAFYSVLTAVGVAVDIAIEIWLHRDREDYFGNGIQYVIQTERDIEEGIQAAQNHWHVTNRSVKSRLTFRNWVRILLCIAAVGLALFEAIWPSTWASLDIGCLSLLPVIMALEIVATRAHKLYAGTVRVSCFIQYLGLGAPTGDNYVMDVAPPRAVTQNRLLEAVPLYSACIRSIQSDLPNRTPGQLEVHEALRSTFTSYTVDIMIKGRRTPFTFIERTSDYDPHDWAIIPKVDVIVLSFSLVDPNFSNQAIERKISDLRRHAPGVPMLLVGDMDCSLVDRHRAVVQMTDLEVQNRVQANAVLARGLVQTQGLACYMGVNHRSHRFGDLLVSAVALYCSLY